MKFSRNCWTGMMNKTKGIRVFYTSSFWSNIPCNCSFLLLIKWYLLAFMRFSVAWPSLHFFSSTCILSLGIQKSFVDAIRLTLKSFELNAEICLFLRRTKKQKLHILLLSLKNWRQNRLWIVKRKITTWKWFFFIILIWVKVIMRPESDGWTNFNIFDKLPWHDINILIISLFTS